MKLKNSKKLPKELKSQRSKQNYIWKEHIKKAMKATELHKHYKESGAQFTMTFSEFKRQHKGKKQ